MSSIITILTSETNADVLTQDRAIKINVLINPTLQGSGGGSLPSTINLVQGDNPISLGASTIKNIEINYTAQRGARIKADKLKIVSDGITPLTPLSVSPVAIPNNGIETCGLTFSSIINNGVLILNVNVDTSDSSIVVFSYLLNIYG